ncbi:MAG TPA: aminodeoxychorismate synthase component I [Bacteroidales bacterium]|nr:aminodeoxychorismate synthase component I [Bacteroidales bacterium]
MESNIMNNFRQMMNKLGSNREPFLFIIDFEMKMPLIYTLDKLPENILFDIPLSRNITRQKGSSAEMSILKNPVTYERYLLSFENVMKNIRHGNSYLLNLTFPTEIVTSSSLDDIFFTSQARYRILMRNKFVVFSPETFIMIDDDTINTFPMKGTIDASVPDAERIIIGDEKEIAEHNTIVDLLRNDLSIVSNNVTVKRFRYIDKIITTDRTLLQVSSRIAGKLDKNWNENIGTIMISLLPAGSVSGAPKKETVRIIRESETGARGYYTGVFGVFDGVSLDSAVMIRYIEQNGSEYVYRSGGGITSLSDPEKEYDELISKVYVPVG